MHVYSHIQDGKTALWLACDRKELKTKSNWLLQQLNEVQILSIENEDENRAVFKVLRHLGLLPKEVQENFDAKDLEKIDAIELQAATAALQASTAAHSDKVGARRGGHTRGENDTCNSRTDAYIHTCSSAP